MDEILMVLNNLNRPMNTIRGLFSLDRKTWLHWTFLIGIAMFLLITLRLNAQESIPEVFQGNKVILMNSSEKPEYVLDFFGKTQSRAVFSQAGLEFQASRFYNRDRKIYRQINENTLNLVGLKSKRTLQVGEGLGVLLTYRYPKIFPDRLRHLAFQLGPYRVAIHKTINLFDSRNSEATFQEYLVPFASLALHGDRDFWFVITHERDGIRLSIMEKGKPNHVMTCKWKLDDLGEPKVAFGMYRNEIIERRQHNGTSHLFKAAWSGQWAMSQFSNIREIPSNDPLHYMKSQLLRVRGKHPMLDVSFDGPLTQKDLKIVRDFYVNEMRLPNYDRHFGNFPYPMIARWIYKKNRDIAIINKTIEACQSIYQARNDIDKNLMVPLIKGTTRPQTRVTESLPPNWPMYRSFWYDNQDKLGIIPGIASYSGVVWSSACARMIAEHLDLWGKKYTGTLPGFKHKTYREIAEILLNRSSTIFDFIIANYLENADREAIIEPFVSKELALYISPGASSEQTGYVPYLNRLLPLLLGQLQAVKAMRALGIDTIYADKLDGIVKDHMAYFEKYITVYERKGLEVLKHPYALSDWPDSDKLNVEDSAHGSFDNKALQFFFEDGYLPEKYAVNYANTIVAMHVEDDLFDAFIDGDPKGSPSRIYGGGDGYFYLAQYNDQVIETLWKSHFNHQFLQVYGILRTKEERK